MSVTHKTRRTVPLHESAVTLPAAQRNTQNSTTQQHSNVRSAHNAAAVSASQPVLPYNNGSNSHRVLTQIISPRPLTQSSQQQQLAAIHTSSAAASRPVTQSRLKAVSSGDSTHSPTLHSPSNTAAVDSAFFKRYGALIAGSAERVSGAIVSGGHDSSLPSTAPSRALTALIASIPSIGLGRTKATLASDSKINDTQQQLLQTMKNQSTDTDKGDSSDASSHDCIATHAELRELVPFLYSMPQQMKACNDRVDSVSLPRAGSATLKRKLQQTGRRHGAATERSSTQLDDQQQHAPVPSKLLIESLIPRSDYRFDREPPALYVSQLDERSSVGNVHSWDAPLFPSQQPDTEQEIKQLTQWFDAAWIKISEQYNRSSGEKKDVVHADSAREQLCFVAYHELLRHVTAHSRARGTLLERVWREWQLLVNRRINHRIDSAMVILEKQYEDKLQTVTQSLHKRLEQALAEKIATKV